MFYTLLKKQITKKEKFTKVEAEELQKKFDVFYLADRIVEEQYTELTEMLKAKTEVLA